MTRINKILSTSVIVIMIVMCCAITFIANGTAFADVVDGDGGISYLEDIYFKNQFNNFLEDTGELPVDKEKLNNKVLYDFSYNASFMLTYSNNSGYMISNRETGTSLEKIGIGDNPYIDVINKKCYYLGVGNYFYDSDSDVLDIMTKNNIESDIKIELQNNIEILKDMDREENGLLNLYARTSNSDRLNNAKYISTEGEKYFNKLVDFPINIDGSKQDMPFPDNDETSCGIVAAIQLLQYLDRLGIVDTTSKFREINDEIDYGGLYFYSNCLTQMMHDELDAMTWSGAWGENYTINVITGLKKFLQKYPPKMKVHIKTPDGLVDQYRTCDAIFSFKDNACYDNMKGQIDSGKPAIGMTSMGNGYYQIGNGSWEKQSVSQHMMIVYGYCTTNKGTLKDFIAHSGWRIEHTQKMYVYKLNFIRNITYSVTADTSGLIV